MRKTKIPFGRHTPGTHHFLLYVESATYLMHFNPNFSRDSTKKSVKKKDLFRFEKLKSNPFQTNLYGFGYLWMFSRYLVVFGGYNTATSRRTNTISAFDLVQRKWVEASESLNLGSKGIMSCKAVLVSNNLTSAGEREMIISNWLRRENIFSIQARGSFKLLFCPRDVSNLISEYFDKGGVVHVLGGHDGICCVGSHRTFFWMNLFGSVKGRE